MTTSPGTSRSSVACGEILDRIEDQMRTAQGRLAEPPLPPVAIAVPLDQLDQDLAGMQDRLTSTARSAEELEATLRVEIEAVDAWSRAWGQARQSLAETLARAI